MSPLPWTWVWVFVLALADFPPLWNKDGASGLVVVWVSSPSSSSWKLARHHCPPFPSLSLIFQRVWDGCCEYLETDVLPFDAVKALHSLWQQIWETQQWPQDWKRVVFIPIPKKSNVKECSNYHTIALISYASKILLKIFQTRLQQYMNQEFPDVQARFRKGQRNQRSNCQHPLGHRKSKGIFKKTSTSASLTLLKPLTLWITTNCGIFLKGLDHFTCLLRSVYAGQEAIGSIWHGTMDWFKIGKGVLFQGCILSPAYLIYMQSTLCKMLG